MEKKKTHRILVYLIEPLDSGSNKGLRILAIPVNAWHFIVLQQDILSTLLLSSQVYKWVPGRMRTLFVSWYGM